MRERERERERERGGGGGYKRTPTNVSTNHTIHFDVLTDIAFTSHGALFSTFRILPCSLLPS